MTDSVDSRSDASRRCAGNRIGGGVVALDDERRVTHVDGAVAALLDVDAEPSVGEPLSEALPALVDDPFESRWRAAQAGGDPVEYERAVPVGDDQLRVRISPGDDGTTVRLERLGDVAGPTDIEEQAIVDALTDAAVTVDSEGTIRRANSAVEPLFGYEPSELEGEPLTTLIPEWLQNRHETGFRRYIETGERTTDWRGIEFPCRRKDGEERELSISFTEHGGSERLITGVFRDISERKEREWALQQAHETFSDPSLAFDGRVRKLLELGSAVLDMEFGTLSEVQAGEYRFDQVLAPDGVDLENGDTVPLSATNCERVLAEGDPLALHDIDSEAPELSERASNVELGIAAYLGVPIVVDGDAIGTFCFYDTDARDEPFSEWEVTFVEHLGQWVANALEQQRYVEQLRALNEINEVVREVAEAIIEESTRAEVEQRVCKSLAATDSYLFAWIGQPNPESQVVELRAEAGVEGYLDGVTISVDADAEEAQGPTGRALQTGEVQTLQRVDVSPEYDPWTEVVAEYGFRASASIPIVHEGTSYGVLNLYTERVDAFEGQEREMVELLGKIVGHAIAAADRKQALLSDSMVELELRTTNVLASLDLSERPDEPVKLEAAVPRTDGEYVVFGEADPADRGFVEELTEKQPYWEELVTIDETEGRLRFEALLLDPPLLEALASAGGQLDRAVLEGADMRMEIRLPPQAEVRKTLDAVRTSYPSTSLVSKQEVVSRRASDSHGVEVTLDGLTDRQLESLRTAYYAGYFEWPRETSGEEVAELLGISAPTFSQHLRGAERAVFGSLFDAESR